MKRFSFLSVLPLFLLLLFAGCDKAANEVTGKVELYLLESFSTLGQSCAIDNSTVVLNNEPLISYAEFISYNSKEYIFKISETAGNLVENQEHSVTGFPFAMVAEDKVIYTGYFWPSLSSAICQWIVIDPLMLQGTNELHVVLGYPGLIEGAVIPDERNSPLIADIFSRDDKLIE